MKTVRLDKGVVAEIIPDYALPVEKWYGVEFAMQCVEAPDEVELGMEYNANDKTFAWATVDISTIKSERIADSKTTLADYLASHPLTWTDGKQYSATEDKQALLTGNLAAYQLAVTLGQTAELTWNATGEECTVWTFESLAALAIAIKAYVKPLVACQQAYEVSVTACTTEDAIMAVPLDYESVGNATT